MSDGSHQRRCWVCGNVEEHKDSITPWVLCTKCRSQDTQFVRRLEPHKYPEYQVPDAEPTPASRKDIDYEDSFRDARDLLLIVSPDVTPLDSLSGIVSQLNNYIAGVNADRAKLLEGIRYWSYCTSEGMRATAPEKCDELFDFLIQCKIAPYYMPDRAP